MHFPTWIDLKGQDSVPDTVHHVVKDLDLKTCEKKITENVSGRKIDQPLSINR